jgi:hypothetical protein
MEARYRATEAASTALAPVGITRSPGHGDLSFTKCDLRHTAFTLAAALKRRISCRRQPRGGDMTDQSDDLNILPGRGRGFTGLILAAVAIVGAFLIIHYYSP